MKALKKYLSRAQDFCEHCGRWTTPAGFELIDCKEDVRHDTKVRLTCGCIVDASRWIARRYQCT